MLDRTLQGAFEKYGRILVTHAWLKLFIGTTTIVSFLSLYHFGYIEIEFESHPEKLWVPINSITAEEKQYYDSHFHPFYRIEQIIITKGDGGDVLNRTVLLALADMLDEIASVAVTVDGRRVTLEDLCFKPVAGRGCIVTSPLDFWNADGQLNRTALASDADLHRTASCIPTRDTPVPCLGSVGQPVVLNTVLGAVKRSPDSVIASAHAAIVTYLLNNDPPLLPAANAWEAAFLDLVARPNGQFRVAYSAQRSIEDELGRMSADPRLKVVIIASYIAMFLYVAVALGGCADRVTSRFALALVGVLLVLASALLALFICAAAGVKVTPIISQLLPFLVLAIGVDNMFILTNAFDRTAPSLPVPERMAHAMRLVGPSITVAAVAECFAFGVGSTTRIPALVSLCSMAATAIAVNYVMHLLCFAPALALDAYRIKARRMDVLFIAVPPAHHPDAEHPAPSATLVAAPAATHTSEGAMGKRGVVARLLGRYFDRCVGRGSFCRRAVWGIACASLLAVVLCCLLPVGLDQRDPLPSDSYLINYFDELDAFVDVGPPLYVITKGGDYESIAAQAALESLQNTAASGAYVSPPVFSWYADLKRWALYCNQYPLHGGKWIPPGNVSLWLRAFVSEPLDSHCCATKAICGAPYANDVLIQSDGSILATRMRAFHVPLKNQRMLVDAYLQTHAALSVTDAPVRSFAYSVFYVFYEQYSNIRLLALFDTLLAALAVLLCTTLLLGELRTAAVLTLCVLLFAAHLGAAMFVLGVPLNAVSLVNIIVGMGLSLEFLVHIARAFAKSVGDTHQRLRVAVVEMGSSVFTGIGCTKVIGVLVLRLAPSALFRTYYFTMLLAILLVGLLHALCILPAFLYTLSRPSSPPPLPRIDETSPLLPAP